MISIGHFTVVFLVSWPWIESEAGVDLVLIETTAFLIAFDEEERILIVPFYRNHSRGFCGPVPRVSIVMPCDFSVWAPFWTGYVAHIASILCANVFLAAVSWNLHVQ